VPSPPELFPGTGSPSVFDDPVSFAPGAGPIKGWDDIDFVGVRESKDLEFPELD
jgi:hypothetical protein